MMKFCSAVALTCLLGADLDAEQPAPTPPPPAGWKLVWSDEFSKPGALDPTKWSYETGMLRNHEAQLYTQDRRENVRVENGCLIIEARKERVPVPGKLGKFAEYTSGSIETRKKGDWLYGRVEVSARLPDGRGMWPAIWMLPTDHSVGWPDGGEIDIMENVGFDPSVMHGSIHTKSFNHVAHTQKSAATTVEHPHRDFHLYAMEWDPQEIVLFVDNKRYFSFKNDGTGPASWPFNKLFHLKLNIAVGGGWGGAKGIDPKIFPQRFTIDYVRVYQRIGSEPNHLQ